MVVLLSLEIALFIWFLINVIYLLIFSIASCRKGEEINQHTHTFRRMVILIPAYREDKVIRECVESCLEQDYPKDSYDVVVISDRMTDETNRELSQLPIILEIAHFENSTKAKALNLAMSHLTGYDIALILDADNTIKPNFLQHVNVAFEHGHHAAYQAHRVAKNLNTNLAYLDAVSEEINNSIFRQGHVNLGLSAALIGSGMAFEYELLKQKLANIQAVGGFDRALELTLFKENISIGYLPDSYVLDEKIQTHDDFTRQRRRWMSAQVHYSLEFMSDLPSAVKYGRWDFCDKMFQQTSIPRLLLLGLNVVIAVVISIISWSLALKWWLLLLLVFISLALAIPRKLYTRRLFIATMELPLTFISMLYNLFCLRGANKSFIHTEHGVKNKTK